MSIIIFTFAAAAIMYAFLVLAWLYLMFKRYRANNVKISLNLPALPWVSNEAQWWRDASKRLGAGVFTYFGFISIVMISLTLLGVSVGIGLVVGIVPLAIFIAVRLSGYLTRKQTWK